MEELRQKILDLCNESGLPLEAVYFVVKDVWRDAENTLLQLKQQEQAKEEEKKEK